MTGYYKRAGLQSTSSMLVCRIIHLPGSAANKPRAGHSMTIVGLELHTNGSRSLLVFDPSYSPCPGIRDLVGVSKIGSRANVHALLRLHRRGDSYLYKYREFELLT